MVMSVGVCECGCGEFGHDVGGLWEELSEPQYEGWQRHRCTKQCSEPCLVARCRDSFDGDGFWVWCRECDIQCSGLFESWSDDPEDGIEFQLLSNTDTGNFSKDVSWPPAIGEQVRVNFSSEELTVTEWITLNEIGDPVRSTTNAVNISLGSVHAAYCERSNGELVLIEPADLN